MGAVYPDELGAGFKKYVDLHLEHKIYEFMCNYVRRIKPDAKWKKILFQNPGSPFFCVLTPSDIAYVLAIIKNGKDVWDQAKSVMNDPNASPPEKKARPLFSAGEGRKRESGKTVWNNDGLEFYYTAERNWREVYNTKEQFTALINGWENWEPKDKSRKDAIRTYWRNEERDDEKKAENIYPSEEKPWWDEGGYDSDLGLKAEYDWEDKTLTKVQKEIGIRGSDDEESNKGDDNDKGGKKVVGGATDNSKEDDDNGEKSRRISKRKSKSAKK